jgi:hypothetical protein
MVNYAILVCQHFGPLLIQFFFFNLAFGQDSISMVVLAWGEGGHKRFNNSVFIAEIIVILWGCFISLPLAVGTTGRKSEKQIAIR